MKAQFLTLTLLMISSGIFAQGKISMVNDSTHLIYFANYLGSSHPADAAFQGQKVPAVLPSGITLLVDLYGGTSAASMTLQTTTGISLANPGRFGPLNFTSPNLVGGTAYSFQIQVRDASFPTASLAMSADAYFGFSQIFTMRPSSTIAFNSIVNPGGTALSTWSAGTYDLGGGEFGAVAIEAIPEPSGNALAVLEVALVFVFRRRK